MLVLWIVFLYLDLHLCFFPGCWRSAQLILQPLWQGAATRLFLLLPCIHSNSGNSPKAIGCPIVGGFFCQRWCQCPDLTGALAFPSQKNKSTLYYLLALHTSFAWVMVDVAVQWKFGSCLSISLVRRQSLHGIRGNGESKFALFCFANAKMWPKLFAVLFYFYFVYIYRKPVNLKKTEYCQNKRCPMQWFKVLNASAIQVFSHISPLWGTDSMIRSRTSQHASLIFCRWGSFCLKDECCLTMREPNPKAKTQGCWGSNACCGLKRAEQRLISNFIVLQAQTLTTENWVLEGEIGEGRWAICYLFLFSPERTWIHTEYGNLRVSHGRDKTSAHKFDKEFGLGRGFAEVAGGCPALALRTWWR